MIERIPRADQENVAFPRMKRVKKTKSKKAAAPEEIIQHQIDGLLDANHIAYLRLPGTLYRAVASHPYISTGVKINIYSYIAGLADNTMLAPLCKFDDVKFALACFVENKSNVGKLHGKQLAKSRELGYNECRTLEQAQAIINAFKRFQVVLSDLLKQHRLYQAPEKLAVQPDLPSSGGPVLPQT